MYMYCKNDMHVLYHVYMCTIHVTHHTRPRAQLYIACIHHF